MRFGFVRFVVVLALLCATALWLPRLSQATTFVSLDQNQLADVSSIAVVATVVDLHSGRSQQAHGAIQTDITLAVEEVLFGDVDLGLLVVRESGGRTADSEERIYGTPKYRVNERVVAFLSERDDGTLYTTGMALGKFSLRTADDGSVKVVRELGEGAFVFDPETGSLSQPGVEVFPGVETLKASKSVRRQRRRRGAVRRVPARMAPPPLVESEAVSEFTYLSGSPGRWFEPDWGQPVRYQVDPTGDAGVGPADSLAAVREAFASWSSVDGASLVLAEDTPLLEPLPFGGCSGGSRLVFNDPYNEISDPTGCSGVLALGGYCTTGERREVGGLAFRRIVVGKVTFNNGWSNCFAWDKCALAEIATHELGHTIGLGHSPETGSIMRSRAYFNGRCSDLGEDDEAGVRSIYPVASASTATPTPTNTRTYTKTPLPTSTRTRTYTRVPTRTSTRTPTNTNAPTRTSTPTNTEAPTDTPTHTPTATQPPVRYTVSGSVNYFGAGQAIAGARVSLEGHPEVDVSTGFDGSFDLPPLDGGRLVLRVAKIGDDGDAISSLDAAYALQAAVGNRALSPLQQLSCDATGDGRVSPLDAVRLLQKKLGVLSSLPVEDRCESKWLFYPLDGPGRSIEPPRLTSEGCVPGSVTLDEVGSDVGDVGFVGALLGDCSGSWIPSGEARAQASTTGARRGRVRLGRLRVRDNKALLPVFVRSGRAYQALDLDIRYDERTLVPVGIEGRRIGSNALLEQRVLRPGVLRVAFASPKRITRRHGVLALVHFEIADGASVLGGVRVLDAKIDERRVRAYSGAARRSVR